MEELDSVASSDISAYSDYGSELSGPSTLADLLERFTVDAQPECTLKLRTMAGPVIVGADLTRITGVGSNIVALVLKPSNADQAWRRLRIDNSGTITLRSRRLHWWLFTLDATGHANPFNRTFDLSYRLATKWDVTRGEYRNKKQFEVSHKAEARAHWSISYSLPAIEGSMGTAARQQVSREVHADVGYAHLSIPRLELVVWPCGRPGELVSSTAAGSGGQNAAAESGTEAIAASADGGCTNGVVAEGPAGSSSVLVAAAPAAGLQPRDGPPGSLSTESGAGQGAGGRSSGMQRKKRGLMQLNSHVACLSDRWWATFGQR